MLIEIAFTLAITYGVLGGVSPDPSISPSFGDCDTSGVATTIATNGGPAVDNHQPEVELPEVSEETICL